MLLFVLFQLFPPERAAQAWAQSPSAPSLPGKQLTSPAATAMREWTDEVGRRVVVPALPRRIVSLAPNLTEIIYALGAEERLAGVTDYCDYPPEAQAKPKVGGAVNPNLEQIVALKPDLVLVTGAMNRRETIEALERLGIAVYGSDPHTVEGVLESMRRLAEVMGVRERGEVLVAGLQARLAELRQRLAGRPAKRVLFVVWHQPLITVGRNTFLADALRRAGAEPVVESEQDWPRLSVEEVVRLQPDYLVFAGSHAEAGMLDDLRARPGWRSLEAIRQGRTAVVSDAVIRPAPRLVDAIEQLARQLHPDAFAAGPRSRGRDVRDGLEIPAEQEPCR